MSYKLAEGSEQYSRSCVRQNAVDTCVGVNQHWLLALFPISPLDHSSIYLRDGSSAVCLSNDTRSTRRASLSLRVVLVRVVFFILYVWRVAGVAGPVCARGGTLTLTLTLLRESY